MVVTEMNEVVQTLGIKTPIIQGGMGNISHAALTASVSEAGGLGTIGAGTMSVNKIEEIIREIRVLTDKPFAINVPLTVHPEVKQLFSLILKEKVPVVSLSAGNPAPYIQPLKEEGIKVICVVANPKQAKKAEAHGADIVVAEGYEAAGINSVEERTTFTLIPAVASAVNIPVIAAGGVGDGRGLLAAFALGAQGVQLGTRLVATKDAKLHDNYKQALLEQTETVITGRPFHKVRRLLKTDYAEELLANQERMKPEEFDEKTNEDRHIKGAVEGKLKEGHLNAGQVTSIINDLPTVEELFRRMEKEAQEIYKNMHINF